MQGPSSKAGSVAVAGYAEAIVHAIIDVPGYGQVVLRPRDAASGVHGTIVKQTSAAYTAATACYAPLVLPVDYIP